MCLDLIPGRFAKEAAQKADASRIATSQKRIEAATLEARRARRRSRMQDSKSNGAADKQAYCAGAF